MIISDEHFVEFYENVDTVELERFEMEFSVENFGYLKIKEVDDHKFPIIVKI